MYVKKETFDKSIDNIKRGLKIINNSRSVQKTQVMIFYSSIL